MLDLSGVSGGGTLGQSKAEQERPYLAAWSGKGRAYKAGRLKSRGAGRESEGVRTTDESAITTRYTDGLKSFEGLKAAGFQHVTRIQPLRAELRKGAKSAVPLADRAIGNLQQWLIGTHHGVSKGQLQVYLDEFVFRHNRRKTPAAAFQTLLGLGTGRKSTKYEQIRRARDLHHNRLGIAEATG